MITINEVEEIIGLINEGYNLKLISFELDIPIEQVEGYKKQLEIRKYARQSIEDGEVQNAIKKLESFIKNLPNCIVEKLMLEKLKAYDKKINVPHEKLKEIEKQRKLIGFSKNIDEILDQLDVQIPKVKIHNKTKRKNNLNDIKKDIDVKDNNPEIKIDYNNIIEKYKTDIKSGLRR